jgi:integrase
VTDDPGGKQKGARANREGKPWQRKDGRWTVRVYPPEGTIDRKPVQVYGRTRKEVTAKRDELAAKLARGLPKDPGLTVGDYMSRWLDETLSQYARAGRLAPSTVNSYRDNARKHIVGEQDPTLAHIRLAALSASMVRAWQDRLLQKPSGRQRRKPRKGEKVSPDAPKLSPRTVAYCHAILRKAVEDALRDGVAGLDRNVVKLVSPPSSKDREEIQPPTVEEATALYAAMMADRFWCYWLVAFTTGFRRGEGLGMKWADLDLETLVWRPGESVQRIGGKLVSKGLKTRASRKPVPLPVAAAEALGRWQVEQKKMRLRSPVWADLDLVFTTGIGTAIEPRNMNRQWVKVCEIAGVTRTIRLHDLRHAFGSYMADEGVAPKVIQHSMRHARFATTSDIYLHALEEIPREGAEAMDRVIARFKGGS